MAGFKSLPDWSEPDGQKRIAVDHQERFIQHAVFERQPQRPASAAQPLAFVHPTDGSNRARFHGPVAANQISTVADAIDHFADALRCQPVQLVMSEGPSTHGQ